MNKSKDQINEMTSLMSRMGLFEANGGVQRIQVGRNDIIDMMEKIQCNWYASITYVSVFKVPVKRDSFDMEKIGKVLDKYKDNTDNGEWYTNLNNFRNNTSIAKASFPPIIKVTKYNLRFPTYAEAAKEYDASTTERTNIRLGAELPQYQGDAHNVGNKIYGGERENQTTKKIGRLINTAKAKVEYNFYSITPNGDIKENVPADVAMSLIKPQSIFTKADLDGLVGKDPAIVNKFKADWTAYSKKYKWVNIVMDNVLAIVATAKDMPQPVSNSDGTTGVKPNTAYYYINDSLGVMINEKEVKDAEKRRQKQAEGGKVRAATYVEPIYVNPQRMRDLAVKELSQSIDAIKNYDPNLLEEKKVRVRKK